MKLISNYKCAYLLCGLLSGEIKTYSWKFEARLKIEEHNTFNIGNLPCLLVSTSKQDTIIACTGSHLIKIQLLNELAFSNIYVKKTFDEIFSFVISLPFNDVDLFLCLSSGLNFYEVDLESNEKYLMEEISIKHVL